MAKKLQGVSTPNERKVAADNFFSSPNNTIQETNPERQVSKKEAPKKTQGKVGRPKKTGLKNENFSLTMNPEIYEKLRIVAAEECNGNVSHLIDLACRHYCEHIGLNLRRITVPQEILDVYAEKQSKSKNKVK